MSIEKEKLRNIIIEKGGIKKMFTEITEEVLLEVEGSGWLVDDWKVLYDKIITWIIN